MQKRLVRVANAVLDLEPYESERRSPNVPSSHSGLLKLDRNETTTGPAPSVIESIKDFLNTKPLNWYPDPDASELKEKIAEYAALPTGYINCYAGVGLALEHIFRTYLETGTEVVISGPVSDDIMKSAQSTGARVVEIDFENPFEPKIEEIVNRITSRTRAVYLKTPNEYTGASFNEAELVFLLAYAERTMIIIDEEFFEFTGRTMADLTARFLNLTIIRSFSGAFGLASLKAAYIITDPENSSFLNRIKGENGPDSIAQIAALSALDNIDYTREYAVGINQSKKALTDNLPDIGYNFRMTSGNFMLLEVSDNAEYIESLDKQGIWVMDLSGMNGLRRFLRITIGTPEQTDKLLLTLSRMAERFATGYNRNRVANAENRIKGEIKKPVSVL
ncbi:MAG: histidinol-phosphate transaminase [candidate division Zixibacteria bacterium]